MTDWLEIGQYYGDEDEQNSEESSDEDELQTCKKCLKPKQLWEFSKRGKDSNRFYTMCKQCRYKPKPKIVKLTGIDKMPEAVKADILYNNGQRTKRILFHCS